jgi:hypothetical protein
MPLGRVLLSGFRPAGACSWCSMIWVRRSSLDPPIPDGIGFDDWIETIRHFIGFESLDFESTGVFAGVQAGR